MAAIDDVRSAVLRVARAAKAGDHAAEALARGDLAFAALRRNIEGVRESGVRLAPAQVAELARLVSLLAGPANPVEHLRQATVAAGMEGPCDACGADGAWLSGSLDLTGTEEPPMTLERLCADCRGRS